MGESAVKIFDGWATDGQAEDMESDHGAAVRLAMPRMGLGPGERVLDLGCGNGWATRLIAGLTKGETLGIDGAANMVERARDKSGGTANIAFDRAPFDDLPSADGWFDCVYSMEALYYAPVLAAAVGEIHRVLKPGGRAEILINYYTENGPTEPWPDLLGVSMQRLSAGEWQGVFTAAGFDPVTTERLCPPAQDDGAFVPNQWVPTRADRAALAENGTLWIRARKPAA